MTTIVYDHKARLIAVDSREVAGDEIKTDSATKHYCVDGIFYFISGSVHDKDNFLCEPKVIRHKPDVEIDCTALIVRNGKVFKGRYDCEIGYWEVELTYSEAIGSGGTYAKCAIDHGKSAKESVQYAATRDIYTGGDVHVFDVDKMEFL